MTQNAILLQFKDDTLNTVSRTTSKRLALTLGMNETAVIHYAMAQLSRQTLPAYVKDDGPLTAAQIKAIRKEVPQEGFVSTGLCCQVFDR